LYINRQHSQRSIDYSLFQLFSLWCAALLQLVQQSGCQDTQASTIAIFCFINSYITDNIHFNWRLHFVWHLSVEAASEIIELMLHATSNKYVNNDAVSLETSVYNSTPFWLLIVTDQTSILQVISLSVPT
jgi:hypothetical protein